MAKVSAHRKPASPRARKGVKREKCWKASRSCAQRWRKKRAKLGFSRDRRRARRRRAEERPSGCAQWLDARRAWRHDLDGGDAPRGAARRPGCGRRCKSVISLGMSYAPGRRSAGAGRHGRTAGRISVYAQGADYHDVVKKALKALARWLVEEAGAATLKVFVDTAPVMEKPLAEAAGLGWQGKHTNLVSRTRRQLAVPRRDLHDAGARAGRAACRCAAAAARACLAACPTDAFPAPVPARCAALHLLSHDRA